MSLTCPRDPGKLMNGLLEKRRLAKKIYEYDGKKVRLKISELVEEYTRYFGKLQTVLEDEPPTQKAYESILYSVPGIIGCLHKMFKERGVLKNEIISLDGMGGIGKSSFVYWLTRFVGGLFINDDKELIYTLKRLIQNREWVPVLVIDDIATMINKYWFMTKRERKWNYLFRALEYAKDWTGLLIMTARSFEGNAKRFRELATLKGTMEAVVVSDRYLVGLITWYRPDSKIPYYVDFYWPGIKIPEDAWNTMMDERRERALYLLEQLEKEDEEAARNEPDMQGDNED